MDRTNKVGDWSVEYGTLIGGEGAEVGGREGSEALSAFLLFELAGSVVSVVLGVANKL